MPFPSAHGIFFYLGKHKLLGLLRLISTFPYEVYIQTVHVLAAIFPSPLCMDRWAGTSLGLDLVIAVFRESNLQGIGICIAVCFVDGAFF